MCYFPASIIQLESSPNRPASGFTLTQRRAALDLRRAETPLREGEPGSGTVWRGFELDDTGGEIAHDGAGKTVAERIRAA
ncbi:hypothetical protein PZE18_27125, partial [Escherichia coli]|nr:hypothetical protein [Escherichia coli]